MTTQSPTYLDVQAEVGITKHLGGFTATDELLTICHIADAKDVLYVGAGIGVGPAYIARKFNCRVVAVDISEKMLVWTSQRTREEGVSEKVETRLANILDLPFAADRFDAVLVESVVAFVNDKVQAVRELVRVAKPGGYVGINETFVFGELSPEMIASANKQLGVEIPTLESWQMLWDASGLQERAVKTFRIDARKQVQSQIQWVGLGWALKAFWRLYRLYRQNPAARQSIHSQFSSGTDFIGKMGYGLFTGKKRIDMITS